MTQPIASNSSIRAALAQIPSGLFILTAGHDGVRAGVLTRWVQACSTTPPLVTVALAKGLPVEPHIRDSRSFALCQVAAADRFLLKMFSRPAQRSEDPFVLLSTRCTPSGAPIIDRALSYLDCEIVRHVDLDADYRLYVGEITRAEILNANEKPAVEIGGGDGSGNGTSGSSTNGTLG